MLVPFIKCDVCRGDYVTQWLIIKAVESDSPLVKPKIDFILSKVFFCFFLFVFV